MSIRPKVAHKLSLSFFVFFLSLQPIQAWTRKVNMRLCIILQSLLQPGHVPPVTIRHPRQNPHPAGVITSSTDKVGFGRSQFWASYTGFCSQASTTLAWNWLGTGFHRIHIDITKHDSMHINRESATKCKYTNPAYQHCGLLQAKAWKVGSPSFGTNEPP